MGGYVMLTIVGTPIGNIDDISVRQIRSLFRADVILAEDTRSAQTLLNTLLSRGYVPAEFTTIPKVISYYREKEMDMIPQIIQWLRQDKEIVLISDAGMPVISDPGSMLIRSVIREDIAFTVVPGPSAVTTALVHAGIPFDQFMFLGFLPKRPGQIEKLLGRIAIIAETLPKTVFVAFESPHRIEQTVRIIRANRPAGRIVVARELTKQFETIYRNDDFFQSPEDLKGEMTLVFT